MNSVKEIPKVSSNIVNRSEHLSFNLTESAYSKSEKLEVNAYLGDSKEIN